MIIKNDNLEESIDYAIGIYNSQFVDEEVWNKRINRKSIEYLPNNEGKKVPDEIIAKFEDFRLILSSSISEQELQDLKEQLADMLEHIKALKNLTGLNINNYLRLKDTRNFDNIPNITVTIDNESDLNNIDIEQIKDVLNSKTNINLIVTIENLKKLNANGDLKVPVKVIIKNVSELNVEDLKKYKCISTVEILDFNCDIEQRKPYTREEYEKIRNEIDKIIAQIKMPEENDPYRERKIFAQVYKLLGKKIYYDHYAVSKKGEKNEKLQVTCRNLLGGLLENKCVCAGYAYILKEVLGCVGIFSEYIGGELQTNNNASNKVDSHAWNKVKLDGQDYWTDLTWDAPYIKKNKYPLRYCLKSTQDFKHSMFKIYYFDGIEGTCTESLTKNEQYMLFKEKVYDKKKKNQTNEQEESNKNYLSVGVQDFADSGSVKASGLRTIANVFRRSTVRSQKKTKEEVQNGRD